MSLSEQQQKRIQGYAKNPLALEALTDRTRPLNLTESEMLTLLHDLELIYMGMADKVYPLR
jgi:hypothetical protein